MALKHKPIGFPGSDLHQWDMAMIEDQRTNGYSPPVLSLETVMEGVTIWPYDKQLKLYQWLNRTFKCRM
jgi:hypothetical protein